MIKKIIRIINKFSLYYGGLGLVIIGVVVSLRGNVSGGVVSVSAGFILFTFGLIEIDRIREFNFFNVAFKLREKLNEAEEIVNQMRSALIPLCSISIASASLELKEHKGRTRRSLFEHVEQVEKSLLEVKTPKETIEVMKKSYYDAILHCMVEDLQDKANEIFMPIRDAFYKDAEEKLAKHHDELASHAIKREDIIDVERYENWSYANIAGIGLTVKQSLLDKGKVDNYFETCRALIYSIDNLGQEYQEVLVKGLEPMLLDIDEYVKTHKIKNLEEFLNKKST